MGNQLIVIGVIVKDNQVLIARRPEHVHLGGLWEFPGGKCEVGEQPEQALKRELNEELGIIVKEYQPFMTTKQSYPDRELTLSAFLILAFVGEPSSCEGQLVKWVNVSQLNDYQFPIANIQFIKKLQQSKYESNMPLQ